MSIPSDRKYTTHDEWALVDGDTVTIGITDYAQDALGELVHVELPEVGSTVAAGEAVAEVESVKAVAEIFTPVGGEIVEVNEDLEDEAEQINETPYESWLFKIKISDAGPLAGLLDAEGYAAKIAD